MNKDEYKEFYERRRPHIHPLGATLFVTFRLAGSIPQAVVKRHQAQKQWLDGQTSRLNRELATNPSTEAQNHQARLQEFHRAWFRECETILHQAKHGPLWLKEDDIARIVADKLRQDDGAKYCLDAYCIMSNHVHVVFAPRLAAAALHEITAPRLQFISDSPTFSQIMHSLKGSTSRNANLALRRNGSFWERESYDHYVRDEPEFDRIVKYTLNNPVQAGLVNRWQD